MAVYRMKYVGRVWKSYIFLVLQSLIVLGLVKKIYILWSNILSKLITYYP